MMVPMTSHQDFFSKAAEIASEATCRRARCGSVIVDEDGNIIGTGFNAPPLGEERQRQCDEKWNTDIKKKSDKTCCVHAEWNAILDALKNNPEKVPGSTLYFMRVDSDGEFTEAGKPYCTVCSRLALQAGITWFGLWNDDAPELWDTRTYNLASYEYFR